MIFYFFKPTEFQSNRFPLYMKNRFRKFLCVIAFITGLNACEKIPDGTLDILEINYKVVSISVPASVIYSSSDSLVTTSIQIQNTGTVKNIWCAISFYDGTLKVNSKVDLFDDGNQSKNGDALKGDNIFSGKFGMSKRFSNGKYQIEYFIEDNTSMSKIVKVAEQYFIFDNNQINFPPVISNLSIPNSVNRGTPFTFSVKVSDPNGLSDIQNVFYRLYRPDGVQLVNSQGISEFPLVDDGNTSASGDITAGDGTYTMILTIPATFQSGLWKFEFQARDKGTPPKLSNTITFNLTVN